MNYSNYQYQILCEDKAHFHFVRGWLEAKGANSRKITSYDTLPHQGCGKEFVISSFERCIQKYRSTAARTKSILIVVIDADNFSVQAMQDKFSSCEEDKVFFVIPKWSIDSWFYVIEHNPAIDDAFEETKYKSHYTKRAPFSTFGKKLAKSIGDMAQVPPSLQTARDTIKTKKRTLGLI